MHWRDTCYFTTLDMASGYYQIEAFVTKYGLFSFHIMPFGLCNAPATFSRSISFVLRGLSWKSVIAVVYQPLTFTYSDT